VHLERPAGRARLLTELAEPGEQARQLPGIPSAVQPPVPTRAARRRAASRRCAQGAPADVRPAHRYALSDFGLTGDQGDERFAGYR
jgi:hypothetical protein